MENRNEIEIDLLGLLLHLKTKIWIILLATVVFAVGGFVWAKVSNTPVYTAEARLYVYQKSANQSTTDDNSFTPDNSSLSVATQLLRDCAVIITGENVTDPVVQSLGLDISPKELGSSVKVKYEDNTRILKLSYTDTDPNRAAEVLNAVCDEAEKQIVDIMKVDALETIYKASVPTVENPINIQKDVITAAIIGAVLAAVVVIVIFLLDDTIRTEDDVENHLGLSTLASIPVSVELKVARPTRKSGKKIPTRR